MEDEDININYADCIFPARARKPVCSLYELGKLSFLRDLYGCVHKLSLLDLMDKHREYFRKVRKFLRIHVKGPVMTDLLDSIIPSDRWRFPCVETFGSELNCNLHWECEVVYYKLPFIIRLMFCEDITHLKVNLQKVQYNLLAGVMSSLFYTLTKLPVRPYPNLRSLVLHGGTGRTDFLAPRVEELCTALVDLTDNLENLHLPIITNIALRTLSSLRGLRALKSDRSRRFNNRGLFYLADPHSQTRQGLEVLHIGVFRHKNFSKEDVTFFLCEMKNLKEFSFLDKDRGMVRWDDESPMGAKVLAYSVFKRTKLELEERDESDLMTRLTEMTVVDRSLKPMYILESAPHLHRLSVDWQEELKFAPFSRYSDAWFSDMLNRPSWAQLSSRLTRLDITFPSAYSPNSYGLPNDDYIRLMESLVNIRSLRFVGAGMMEPLPLLPTLRYCPYLEELVLEQTPVFVPGRHQETRKEFISHSVTKFCYLSELATLMEQDSFTLAIATYMPQLTHLEIQPQCLLDFEGLAIKKLRDLNSLQHLERLSFPLSLHDSSSNLPEIIFVLREFPALRYLVLSWGKKHDAFNNINHKIGFMTAWLISVMQAENANIHLQLSSQHHRREYTRFRY